ncbi:MAG: sigma-54-dependent Fis family transcriptional regulator [Deltaproteobacteria bacterium]|nr:sigma-54-dependent Fis family transcriptional regulator [Deltaproteobacteria bacterium]
MQNDKVATPDSASSRPRILLVEDDRSVLDTLVRTLRLDHYEILTALSGEEALAVLEQHGEVAVIIADQRMPGMSGTDFLRHTIEPFPNTTRIILTGYTDIDSLVEAINAGRVYRYIAKPWDTRELRLTIQRAVEAYTLVSENARLTRELSEANERLRGEVTHLRQDAWEHNRFDNLIGTGPGMDAVRKLMRRAAVSDITVLIVGETGTGKELIARAIHYAGARREALFVAQNCAAVPHDLLESVLFGHRKGSFTGAVGDQKGLFEVADGGTIFLDEIGETSPAMQAKLLRVLEEGEYTRVGDTAPRSVDVRVISATHRQLEDEILAGRFRQDLYYRINAFPITVPPLRERREDVALLAKHFLERWQSDTGRRLAGISDEALALLGEYAFPGNVRELKNEIERAATLADDSEPILSNLLSEKVRQGEVPADGAPPYDLRTALRKFERQFVLDVLNRNRANVSQTARDLGLTRAGLQRKLRELGVAVRTSSD